MTSMAQALSVVDRLSRLLRDEIAAMETRLQAAGVEIDTSFDWPNGARSLYVRDPAGNSVEFAEPWLWDEMKG